ncbi:hypothetical protein [Novosphingobium profundi]|uniref:hypothetical protein n=1 Tax=Novosphingobium profundi TaxID=1774954 RepID=UPI001CFD360C|nr:hypothetical protein [Novosphingobium profundi]
MHRAITLLLSGSRGGLASVQRIAVFALVALGLALSPVLSGTGEASPAPSHTMSMAHTGCETSSHGAGHDNAHGEAPLANLHCMASCLAATGLALPDLPAPPALRPLHRERPQPRAMAALASHASPLDPPPPRAV